MEELIKKITSILDQFFREEAGNRLSQFSMLSLKNMILTEIMNYKPVQAKSEAKEIVKK